MGKIYWVAFYAVQHDEDSDTFRLCKSNYFGRYYSDHCWKKRKKNYGINTWPFILAQMPVTFCLAPD